MYAVVIGYNTPLLLVDIFAPHLVKCACAKQPAAHTHTHTHTRMHIIHTLHTRAHAQIRFTNARADAEVARQQQDQDNSPAANTLSQLDVASVDYTFLLTLFIFKRYLEHPAMSY